MSANASHKAALSDEGKRSTRSKLRERFRAPRRLRPTRAGWCFFGITFFVGFAAMNTGNNLLYLVQSLLLAFLVLSGLLSEAALRGVRVRRSFPSAAHAEQAASVSLEIVNDQKRFPAFALVVEDHTSETESAIGQVFALRIDAGARCARRYSLRAERRGQLAFSGVRVLTRFPFGLFTKERWLDLPGSLLVYPALDPLRGRTRRPRGNDAAESSAEPAPGGALAGALREFADGDSLRRVHWPSTLRRGRLHVRETEDELAPEVWVRLATAGASEGPSFEAAVSRAATEVVEQLDAGMKVGLETDSQRESPGSGARHRARMLTLLACVAPDPPVRDARGARAEGCEAPPVESAA